MPRVLTSKENNLFFCNLNISYYAYSHFINFIVALPYGWQQHTAIIYDSCESPP